MTRVYRWLLLSAVLGGGLCLPACQPNGSFGGDVTAATGQPEPPKEIGLPLFPKKPMPALVAASGTRDAIVVPNAVVKVAEKQLVPAQVDGYVELIAVQLPPGTKYDANDKRIGHHPRDKEKTRVFRQVVPGMTVKRGDIVAWLDDSQIRAQYENSRKLIASATTGIKSAKEGVIQVENLIKKNEAAGSAISVQESIQLLIQKTRFEENLATSEQTQIKAIQDYETAESLLRKHQPMAAVTGRVTNVFKHPGEFAKAGEPILEIQATEEVLIEGEMPIQYVGQVRNGASVRIESTRPQAESRDLGSVSHRREVTGIAVTTHPGRPLVVSAGLDGVAIVWEPFAKKSASLPHPVAVRSVAVTGATASGSYAATGGDDGKIRFWNLSNPDKLPTKESDAKVSEDGHGAGVTAIAFSPDGKTVASAAGREVILWEVATGKKLYTLPAEHRDAVTALRFTPQCTLVTVCRDKAVRTWNLGAQGAALDKTIDHRAGVVDHLAVSADGGRVLFDQDDARLDLVSLADGQSVGTIQAAGQARFATFAAFSPDDGLVLTAGGGSAPGEMQLWEAPKARGGRGFERIRMVTPGRAPVTCAAFSADGEKKFMVVGTATGGIYAWTPPGDKETRHLTGTVESVLPYNDKAALIRVRVSNPPADLLQDRGTANVVIDPDAVAVTPGSGLTVPQLATPVPAPAPVTPAVATSPVSTPTITAPAVTGLPPVTGLGTPPVPVPDPAPKSSVSPGGLLPIPTVPDPKKPN
jgi:WD40 repeat protein